ESRVDQRDDSAVWSRHDADGRDPRGRGQCARNSAGYTTTECREPAHDFTQHTAVEHTERAQLASEHFREGHRRDRIAEFTELGELSDRNTYQRVIRSLSCRSSTRSLGNRAFDEKARYVGDPTTFLCKESTKKSAFQKKKSPGHHIESNCPIVSASCF